MSEAKKTCIEPLPPEEWRRRAEVIVQMRLGGAGTQEITAALGLGKSQYFRILQRKDYKEIEARIKAAAAVKEMREMMRAVEYRGDPEKMRIRAEKLSWSMIVEALETRMVAGQKASPATLLALARDVLDRNPKFCRVQKSARNAESGRGLPPDLLKKLNGMDRGGEDDAADPALDA